MLVLLLLGNGEYVLFLNILEHSGNSGPMEETPEWLLSIRCAGFLWVPHPPCWHIGICWFVFSYARLLQLPYFCSTSVTSSLLYHRVVIANRCSFYNHHLSSIATDIAFAVPITVAEGSLITRIMALLYDSFNCHLTPCLHVIFSKNQKHTSLRLDRKTSM